MTYPDPRAALVQVDVQRLQKARDYALYAYIEFTAMLSEAGHGPHPTPSPDVPPAPVADVVRLDTRRRGGA